MSSQSRPKHINKQIWRQQNRIQVQLQDPAVNMRWRKISLITRLEVLNKFWVNHSEEQSTMAICSFS